jgi:hypothetical protein
MSAKRDIVMALPRIANPDRCPPEGLRIQHDPSIFNDVQINRVQTQNDSQCLGSSE